jgi:transcription antitermination factor NusG
MNPSLEPSRIGPDQTGEPFAGQTWAVAHTQPRAEKVVAERLERLNVMYYLPLVHVQRKYRKSKACFDLPLFPGYVFVAGGERGCAAAYQTQRIVSILPVVDQATLQTELSQIERALRSGGQVELFPSIQVGRRCRITRGPLRDMEGVVVRRGRHWRMHLAITMIGQSAVVEVDSTILEPLDAENG